MLGAQLLRALFVSAGAFGAGALPALALLYGYDLAYRYEVAAITIAWLALTVAGGLLSLHFWRGQGKEEP